MNNTQAREIHINTIINFIPTVVTHVTVQMEVIGETRK